MTNTTGARADMIKLIQEKGWELDPSVILPARYGIHAQGERKQHPHAFVRPAERGGQYSIVLDYVVKESYGGRFDDRLRRIDVYCRSTPEADRRHVATLFSPTKYSLFNGLFEALGPGTLRQRAERMFRDIDLALWLGAEMNHVHTTVQRAQWDEERATRFAQTRSLSAVAIGNGSHDYGSPWKDVSAPLKHAAASLYCADGTTDVVALIVKAQNAMKDVISALTDEAQDELFVAMMVKETASA